LLAEESRPRTILFLDQSEMRGPFYYDIFSAFRTVLDQQSGLPVTLYTEKLDLSRFTGAAYEQTLLQNLQAKYSDRPIGAIFAIGSATLDFVLRWRSTLWPDTPVVFAMVDKSTVDQLKLPADVTGHTVRLSLADEIVAARAAVPDLKHIALVGDAWDIQVVYRQWKDEIPSATAGLEVIDLVGLTMRELQKRVAQLPDRTAIVYTAIYSDGAGNFFPPADAIALVAKTANRPIIVGAETFVGRGALGGYVLLPAVIGQQAAESALGILNGQSSSQASAAAAVRAIFDWRQMQRWSISESRLPPGSAIAFRDASLSERYRTQILGILAAVFVQTGLIMWLIYEHRLRYRAELHSRGAMAELTFMNRRAAAGELSASIAHEVNQPLTGIVTRASAVRRWLAVEKPDLDKVKAAIDQIENAGHRAADVIASVRAMFQKDSTKKSPTDVNRLVLTVLSIVRVELQKNGIEVETRLDEALPIVQGDKVQLQQVILNLVMNAIDAMQTVHWRRLKISTETNDGTVRVSIEDTGTGIDPSKRDQLFKPLFTTKASGMGMGLLICRSIIESHDGRIWASPGATQGSIFQFELPTNDDKA
jgi:signal transduction histidine kinase